jgi:hypothetical protein
MISGKARANCRALYETTLCIYFLEYAPPEQDMVFKKEDLR